jgi:hypothetical protein
LPGDGTASLGAAFAVAHDAADRCFALIHWWHGNEVHQRMLSAPLADPAALTDHPGPAIGCVWELAVVDFERRAWLTHVLASPAGPAVDDYLDTHLEATL